MNQKLLSFPAFIGLVAIGWLQGNDLLAQQSYTFTNASSTGSAGPTQLMVNTAYGSTNLSGSVTVNPQGVQNFTIPVTGPYRIETRGGQGYGQFGGRGAVMIGDFTLTAGTVLKIVVGQAGGAPIGSSNQFGGGGGSFVTFTNNTPLIVAGGGGGSWATSFQANSDGTVVMNGNDGMNGAGGNGTGGTGGNGGNASAFADAGGGITGNGGGTAGGLSFVNGAVGGANRGQGGFGGGGGTSSWDNYRGGGGGGYSGGGGAAGNTTAGSPQGGGGGSFNSGTGQVNASGANSGHGRVIITELCPLNITSAGSANSVNPIICAGQSLTLTTNGVSNYSWSTGQTGMQSIIVAPSTNTVFHVTATTTLNCSTTAYISVTVSSGPPTLSISQSTASTCMGNTVSLSASGALSYTWSHGGPNGAVLTPPSGNNTYTVYGQNGCGTSNATAVVSISPLPVSATVSHTLICEGKTTTLSATGAATYTWLPTNQTGSFVVSSASAPTVFTVTGTSGSCTGTYTFMVQTKPNPTITMVGTAITICEGETVGITVNGGDSYTWTPSNLSGTSVTVAPTVPTLYQVVGENSVGCTSSAQHVVVTQSPPQPIGNLTNTTICLGKPVTLSVTGGATSFTWAHGGSASGTTVAPVTSTVYSVLLGHNDNTCTASMSFSVDVVTAHLAVSQSTAICKGSAVTLTSSAGTGHVWSPGGPAQNLVNVSPVNTTTYAVSANVQTMNVICAASNSVVVTVNPNPTVTATASRTNICRNEVITLNGFGATSFQWSNQQTGASATFSSNTAGQPKVTVTGTDANGCTDGAEIQLIVGACNGIGENSSGGFMVYPNPSQGSFVVKGGQAAEVTLYNSLGQKLQTAMLNADNNFELNFEGHDPGVYFVKMSGSDEHTKTVIVTR